MISANAKPDVRKMRADSGISLLCQSSLPLVSDKSI